MPRQKIALVTGAAGFIGRNLSSKLISRGMHVIGVDLAEWRSFPGEKWITKNVLDLKEQDLSVTEINYIFHLPALVGVRAAAKSREATYSSIISPLQRMLEMQRFISCENFIFMSSSEVYGEGKDRILTEDSALEPLSYYGKAKQESEMLVRQWSADTQNDSAIIRPFNVYGPGQRNDFVISAFIDSALSGKPITIVNDGLQTRTPTYIDDLVEGTIKIASNSTNSTCPIFNIAGNETVTLLELAELIKEICKSNSPIVHVDSDAVGRPSEIEISQRIPECSKAALEANFKPTFDLHSGILSTVNSKYASTE